MPHHEPQHPLLRVITVPREPLARDQTLFYPSNAKFWRGNSVDHFNFPWSHPVWISSPPTEITKHPIRVLKLGWSCASISPICQTLSSLRVKNTSALFTTVSSESQRTSSKWKMLNRYMLTEHGRLHGANLKSIPAEGEHM